MGFGESEITSDTWKKVPTPAHVLRITVNTLHFAALTFTDQGSTFANLGAAAEHRRVPSVK